MKQLRNYLLLALLIIVGSAYGDDHLTVADFTIKPGETFELSVGLENPDHQYIMTQFDMELPTGVTLAKNNKDKFITKKSDRFEETHSLKVSKLDGDGNFYRFLIYSDDNDPLIDNTGELFKVTLQAASDAPTGKFQGRVFGQVFSDPNKVEYNPAAFTFNVTVGEESAPSMTEFYIMGNGTDNAWDGTTAMTLNTETNAFEYEATLTGDSYIAFGDAAFTDWDDFNANHRYAIAAGDQTVTLDETTHQATVQLVKANGSIKLTEAGKFLFSVSMDKQLTITKTGDVVEPATISSVQLLGDWNWDSAKEPLTLTKGEGNVWTGELDLSSVTDDQQFKLVVNSSTWIGNGSTMVITAPEGWVDGQTEGNFNYILKNSTTGYQTYTITAAWTPDVDASKGWILTIAGKDERPAVTPTPAFADGTYYVKNASTGLLASSLSATGLDNLGTPLTFTFDSTTGTYSVTGITLLEGKQWTAEGDGYYTFSTMVENVKMYAAVSAENTLAPTPDGTGDEAKWILLQQEYWEDVALRYNVAGTADLCGTAWDTNANTMTKNTETGLYEWTAEDIAVSETIKPEFKVAISDVADSENIKVVGWIPTDDNWIITLGALSSGETPAEAGLYDITITFNATTKIIAVAGVRKGDIPVVAEPEYYLTGTMTGWSQDATALANYKLTLNEAAESGVEEYVITNVNLEANTAFKVIKIDVEPVWYPAGNDNDYIILEAGIYDIYFRPNADGGDDWHEGYIYAEYKGSATGINAVSTTANNAVIFNMAGQRVEKAQKGLFIINGKKVVR